MDYKALLTKYMAYVLSCEGTDYVEEIAEGEPSRIRFTKEQREELEAISQEAIKLSGRSEL